MQLAQSLPERGALPSLPVGSGDAEMAIGVAPAALDSPHAKTFLLLLAHFYKLALPITDYVNDTKSVLEQFNRLVGSLMEVVVHLSAPSTETWWPAVAVPPSRVLAALATLSAMVARGEPYRPFSKRQAGKVTLNKATRGGSQGVKLALTLSGLHEKAQASHDAHGSRKNQADSSVWIFVVLLDASSGREVVLAAKKLEMSDKHLGQRIVDVKTLTATEGECSVRIFDTGRQSLAVTSRVESN